MVLRAIITIDISPPAPHVSRLPGSPLVVSGVSQSESQPSESPRDILTSVIIIITR